MINLKKCVNYLNKVVVGSTTWKLRDKLYNSKTVYKKEFSSVLEMAERLHLKGDSPDVDGFSRLDECFRNTYYDNGKPLTCDEYDYFEHYDRDQEFWGWFDDNKITRVFEHNGEIHFEVDCSLRSLKKIVHDNYEGSSYEHDFDDDDYDDDCDEDDDD